MCLSFIKEGNTLPSGKKTATDTWTLAKCINPASIDNPMERMVAVNQVYRIDFNFESSNFSVYSLGGKQFLDFTVNDPRYGLSGTRNPAKAGVYLMPPKHKKKPQSHPLDKYKQFILSDSSYPKGANFMVGVSDGKKPDVWIGRDSPYSSYANIDNFIWALEKWNS